MRELPRMQRWVLSPVCVQLYRAKVARPLIRRILRRVEGGKMYSLTMRQILRKYEGVQVGDYSYWADAAWAIFDRGTQIGRFSSIAPGFRILRRNHPTDRISTHPLWYNERVGLVAQDTISNVIDNPLKIGSDVWIGLNVIVCPGCSSIGDGAVVAAGSVVTRDVPPFTIVGGTPARLIRRRFPPEVETIVAGSQWWLRPVVDIAPHLDLFTERITDESLRRFANAFTHAAVDASMRPPCQA